MAIVRPTGRKHFQGVVMDEKTKSLICLGASVAANCVSCFNYHYKNALAAGLDPEAIRMAVELGRKVNRGAHIALMNAVEGAASGGVCASVDGGAANGSSCCG
jgi:AhpD family alkylhydroperoxidase